MPEQLSLFDKQPEEHTSDIQESMQEIAPIELRKDIPNTRLVDLIPDNAVLELLRHYDIRAMHISRILTLVRNESRHDNSLTREEISQELNMTKAQGKGTINVIRRLALLDKKNNLTALGQLVIGTCPYLDDTGLLWVLHYFIASDAQIIVWANLFDMVLFDQDEISSLEAAKSYHSLAGRWSEYTIQRKIPTEIKAIFRTYSDELFSRLRLVKQDNKDKYIGFWETGSIHNLVWLGILLIYRDRYYPGASALEIPLIVKAHYSPGRILRINEAGVRRALDNLHNAGLITVETRSGLDQIRFKREPSWIGAIASYFQEK